MCAQHSSERQQSPGAESQPDESLGSERWGSWAMSELPQEPGDPAVDPLPTWIPSLPLIPTLRFIVSKEVKLLSLSGAQGLQITSL